MSVSVTGNGLANNGDYIKAIKCFTEAIRLDPSEFRFGLVFLHAKAATAFSASLPSQFCLSVRLSVTRVDQSKTVQATITKFSPLAAWKTLVSGTVKLFHKFEGGHPE